MKVSDYIVSFLIEKGISDVFGYPGGMVAHILDSFDKYRNQIKTHLLYHEQGCALAACAYAQATGKLGVAYASSGPGATNLITGIANAYFDSIPTLFITGQANTYEQKGSLPIRQRGFQELDIVSMVQPVTKYSQMITDKESVCKCLNKAYQVANSGRKGPVLLDIPMDIQRQEIEVEDGSKEELLPTVPYFPEVQIPVRDVLYALKNAERPLILVGQGLKAYKEKSLIRKIAAKWKIPFISSMLAVDIFENQSPYYFGFIGAYGHRYANIIAYKSDLILSFASRLDVRQTGNDRSMFAPNAKIVRFDIDCGELEHFVRPEDVQIECDALYALNLLYSENEPVDLHSNWLHQCNSIKSILEKMDYEPANQFVFQLGKQIPDFCTVTTDVGQNQIWVAQSFPVKPNQLLLFSGGLGAMGYSLPAAIGAYYATKRPVYAFVGDGGFMMNVQELQFLKREKIPIHIVVFNNYSLGMIRHFQEMYFESNEVQTVSGRGYEAPDFKKLAVAFEITYQKITSEDALSANFNTENLFPSLTEIVLNDHTHLFPKSSVNHPIYDQEPLMDRALLQQLLED